MQGFYALIDRLGRCEGDEQQALQQRLWHHAAVSGLHIRYALLPEA